MLAWKRNLGMVSSAVLLAAILAAPARADEQPVQALPPTPQSAGNSSQFEQIVVTANKRVENAKDVPTSISVLDGAELSEHHVDDYEDITRTIPGVSFATHGAVGQDNIEVRGVSSTVGNPTVGLYIDDVPIITVNGYEGDAQPRLIDLDRIEVLRGPQGTLYGASSEGGTIRFITAQPDLGQYYTNLTSSISGTAHGGVNYDEQAIQNIPVTDNFALRAAVEYGDTSGYINQFAQDGQLEKAGVNDERSGMFRLTGKYVAGDDLTITPSIFFQRIKDSDSPEFYPSLGLYNQEKSVTEFDRDTMFIPSLTINKGLGFADFTSVTSYFWRQAAKEDDGTAFNSAAIAEFVLDPAYPQFQKQNDSILANVASPVNFTDTFNTETQEFRFNSTPQSQFGLPMKWVAGLFYSNQSWTHRDWEFAPGFSKDFDQIYGFDINQSVLGIAGQPNIWANDLVWFVSDRNSIRQYAAFGQVDYDLLPDLHAAAGLRYVYARESFTEVGGGYFDYGNAGTTAPYSQVARFYAPTPKFSLTYDINDLTTAYATIAKGFRLGGATTPNDNVACLEGFQQLGLTNPPTSYGSDHLWSYETGVKSTALDKTLSVNADVYYIDWQKIQQTITIPICGGAFNSNVGDAEAYGGELELRYKPPMLKGLTLGLNAGAEHATITSTVNAQTAAVGEKVLYTPDWTATFVVDYNWQITPNLLGFIRTDYDWTGRSHGSFQQSDPNFSDPQYGVLNGSVGLDTGDLQVSIFAKNLTDNQTIIQRPAINTVVEGYTVRPMTVGLMVSKQF